MQTRAFRHRDRLGERERAFTSAIYYTGVTHEYDRAVAAYLTALEVDPTDVLGAQQPRPSSTPSSGNSRARRSSTPGRCARTPRSWSSGTGFSRCSSTRASSPRPAGSSTGRTPGFRAISTSNTPRSISPRRCGDYAAAARHARLMAEGSPDDAIRRADGYRTLADIALLQGKVDGSVRDRAHRRCTPKRKADSSGTTCSTASPSRPATCWVRKTPPSDSAAAGAARPLSARLDPAARPAVRGARRRVFGRWASRSGPSRWPQDFTRNGLAAGRFGEAARHHMLGAAALAGGALWRRGAGAAPGGRGRAVPDLRAARAGACVRSGRRRRLRRRGLRALPRTPWIGRLEVDAIHFPRVFERLGELYEARHDPERAAIMYRRMVALWREADPELRPRVAAVERRLAALTVERK